MSNKNKKSREKLNVRFRQEIINFFSENPGVGYNYKQIAAFLEVTDKALRKLIFELLLGLKEEGVLRETERGKFKFNTSQLVIEGKVDMAKRGVGYIISDQLEEDLMVPVKYMNQVMHGDLVKAEVIKSRGRLNAQGRIIEVLNRSERRFVGTIDVQKKYAFLIPDDPKITVDIFIPNGKTRKAENGDKVIGRITDWPEGAKNPFGEIVEVLGATDSNEVQMKAILACQGINFSFPDEVIAQANAIRVELDQEEIARRKDFRSVLTFTIDPVDAKDFDDALSVEFLENDITRIGVHIADVAYYVQPGSALDKEALDRGN